MAEQNAENGAVWDGKGAFKGNATIR